jgi:hypothetical protein
MLHEALPDLPEGAVAVEVEITTDVRSAGNPPLEARIISMIEGDFEGTKLRFDPRINTSCDGYPYLGTRGIAVGYVLSTSDGILVIDPIRAPSAVERERQNALSAEPAANP